MIIHYAKANQGVFSCSKAEYQMNYNLRFNNL